IKDKLDLDQNGSLVDATKYRSIIGSLMYLTSSRPDIVHATCLCARYQAKPTKKHLKEVACKDTFKCTFGGAQFLGEKLVSWSSKKQDCMALSTAEAEYVSLSACCAQVLWMRTQLTDYGFPFNKIPIYCDSKSTIAISYNPVQHSRTKHIAVRYHFIKENVEKGTIELYFVKTDYQLAELFTKALLVDRFNYLVRRLGGGINRGSFLVSTEGVEEGKKIVMVKGGEIEERSHPYNLWLKPGHAYSIGNHKDDLILKTKSSGDPVMQCTTLSSHSESLKRFLFHFSRISTRFYQLSHSEIVDIEKVAVRSSL
ncbi:hypothetical protein Tco_1286661, partial [Tanacetum coccineum]